MDDERAGALLASVSEDERGECWWLVLRDGTPLRGDAGAGVAVMCEIRVLAPLGRLLQRLGLSPLVDALDRVVSRHRRRLGRLVPDGRSPSRYP